MADIRINALANTATTPASDDYLALDGSAQGTRKILATNIANNVTDVILGSSGPSVKSSLSARAARQGLVFDGSGGNGTFTAVPIGSGDFSVSALVNLTSYLATGRIISRGSAWEFGVYSDGRIYVYNGTTVLFSTSLAPIGKACLISYTKSGSSGTFYLNGISAGTVTDNNTYTSASEIGGNAANNAWLGTIQSFLIYNRALSASEVVALYEAGAPSGADYNSASNTSVVTGFANGTYTTFTGASATGFTATSSGGSAYATNLPAGNTQPVIKAGSRVRVSFTATLTSGVAPTFQMRNNASGDEGTFVVTAGSNSQIITMSKPSASDGLGNCYFGSNGATNYTISNFSLTNLGLLLAPDAAQAGGGLVWYDTSGNAANISWTSGVSWNVPTSGKMATSLTIGGTGTGLTLSPTSGPATLAINGPSAGSVINYQLSGTNKYTAEYVSSSDFYAIGRSGVAYDLVLKSGNLLIGKTTDSANGKLQLADHTTSAGGIGFGTETQIYRRAAGNVAIDSNQGSTILTLSYLGNVEGSLSGSSSGGLTLAANGATSLLLTTNGTTALTLDSGQNATFARDIYSGTNGSVSGKLSIRNATTNAEGNIYGATSGGLRVDTGSNAYPIYLDGVRVQLSSPLRLGNAYVAGAPTATGYVTIQDSAGNTYKVLVGT